MATKSKCRHGGTTEPKRKYLVSRHWRHSWESRWHCYRRTRSPDLCRPYLAKVCEAAPRSPGSVGWSAPGK